MFVRQVLREEVRRTHAQTELRFTVYIRLAGSAGSPAGPPSATYRFCRCISRPFSIKNRPKKIDLDLYTES